MSENYRGPMFWVHYADLSGTFKDVWSLDSAHKTEEEAMARMRQIVSEGKRAKYELTDSPACWAR